MAGEALLGDDVARIAAMNRWGDRWLAGEDGPPITLHHRTCGHEATAEVVCAHCHAPLHAEDVVARPGPGYPAKLLARPDVRQRFDLDGSDDD
ncbi:hypothetical protein ACFVH6_08290 [Spirillospora sp. NPDC127200]